MNSVEAHRVLGVLDEAFEGLRLFSYITPEVLESADQLVSEFGKDITHALLKYRQALNKAKGAVGHPDVFTATVQLWRKFRNSPAAEGKLRALRAEQSTGFLQLLASFKDLRKYTHHKLTTTVEEDISNREFYEEVKEREEKALTEKTQKEQQLRLERIERQKQMATITDNEAKARADLEAIAKGSQAASSALKQDSSMARNRDESFYQERHDELTKEINAAKAELATLQEDNRYAEGTLRKQRKKAEQSVEAAIGEYDNELGDREKEYQQEMAVYNEVQNKLQEYEQGWMQMRAEREDYEEQQRIKAEKERKATLSLILENHMAKVIQGAWANFRNAKEAAKKAEKKGKKGKKKK